MALGNTALYGIGAGINAVSNVFGNLFGSSEASKNRKWQEKMINQQNEYNSPTNQVARLVDAGLNPALSYGNVSTGVQTSAGTGAQASDTSSKFDYMANILNAKNVQSQIAVNKSVEKLNAANAEKALTDAKIQKETLWNNQKQFMLTQGFELQKWREGYLPQITQGIKESQQDIEKTQQDIRESMARVDNMRQSIAIALEKLPKELALMEKQGKALIMSATAALRQAHAAEINASTNIFNAQTSRAAQQSLSAFQNAQIRALELLTPEQARNLRANTNNIRFNTYRGWKLLDGDIKLQGAQLKSMQANIRLCYEQVENLRKQNKWYDAQQLMDCTLKMTECYKNFIGTNVSALQSFSQFMPKGISF